MPPMRRHIRTANRSVQNRQNMKLQEKGDILEKLNYAFISSQLPAYEKIWEKFISCHSDKYKHNEERKKKHRLAQLLYTCLHGTIALKRIVEKYSTNEVFIDKTDPSKYLNQVLDFLDDLMLFQSHIGTVSEIIRKEVQALVKGINGKELLGKFFESRNNVVHSQRIPITVAEDGILLIPIFRGQGNLNGWRHKNGDEIVTWTDVDPNDFQFPTDYFKDFFTEFIPELNMAFEKILSSLPETWRCVDELRMEHLNAETFISGSLGTDNFNKLR